MVSLPISLITAMQRLLSVKNAEHHVDRKIAICDNCAKISTRTHNLARTSTGIVVFSSPTSRNATESIRPVSSNTIASKPLPIASCRNLAGHSSPHALARRDGANTSESA